LNVFKITPSSFDEGVFLYLNEIAVHCMVFTSSKENVGTSGGNDGRGIILKT
jgi:hypothetical protein